MSSVTELKDNLGSSLKAKPATLEDLAKKLGYNEYAVWPLVASLRNDGYIKELKSGVFKVTAKGQRYLEAKGY